MRTLVAALVLFYIASIIGNWAGTTDAGSQGQYLGNLSANPDDPNSMANPYGRHGW
jgi:hypothetical protein